MNTKKIQQEWGLAVALDIITRAGREKEKAVEKYGNEAIAPGGRPEFDVLDFSINEIVGLDRYGEMLTHRFANTAGTDFDLVAIGLAMREVSEILAPAMVAARHVLMEENGSLGVTEMNRFMVPDQKHAERVLIEGPEIPIETLIRSGIK